MAIRNGQEARTKANPTPKSDSYIMGAETKNLLVFK